MSLNFMLRPLIRTTLPIQLKKKSNDSIFQIISKFVNTHFLYCEWSLLTSLFFFFWGGGGGGGGEGGKEGTLVVLAGFSFCFFLVRGLFLLTHNVTNLILKHT